MDFTTRPDLSIDDGPAVSAPVGAPAFPERPDVSFITDDGGWDTYLWSLLPFTPERGPKDLGEMADAIDAQVGEDGQIGDFNLIGHGVPGAMATGEQTIGRSVPGRVYDDENALIDIAGHMPDDAEIVLGGCNFAAGTEQNPTAGVDEMMRLAQLTDQRVSGGVSVQLPFPGIEGTKVTAIPGVDGGPPTYETRSTWFDQAYDALASLYENKLPIKEAKQEKLGDKLDGTLGPVAPPLEPVLPPITLPPSP
jgi:hypothetical protein